MKSRLSIPEFTMRPLPNGEGLNVTAQLQYTSDKGTESLNISVRLPAGDRSILELQRELISRANLLLEAASDDFQSGQPSKLDVWEALAR